MGKHLDTDTHDTLIELNEDLKLRNLQINIAIIGGTLGQYHLEGQYRGTMDIDIVTEGNITNEIDHLFKVHGLHMATVAEVPPMEDLSREYEYTFSNLNVILPSLEMFAVYKLMTPRGKDYEDLIRYPILDKCDINKVKSLIDEYKNYIVSPNNPDLNYKQLDEILKIRNLDKD